MLLMRKVSHLTDKETYLLRAAEARTQAEEATLDNVRERCMRSVAAWTAMAERAERNEKMRETLAAQKAAAEAAAEQESN